MLTLSLALQGASAYSLREGSDGTPVAWDTFPIAWQQGPDGGLPAAADEIRAAFETWERVDTVGLSFDREDRGSSPLEEAPDDVHLVWSTTDWPFDDELLALTSTWSDEQGTIVAFDVRINGNQPWSTDGDPDTYDLRAAMTHEVGHVLGIEHSDLEDAAMFARTLRGEGWRAELHEDDEDAARFLYGQLPGEVTKAVGCSTGGTGASWAAGLAALLLVARRGGAR